MASATGNKSDELTRVIDELTRGREIADQLLSMLRDDDVASVTGNMVEKILDSFTGSLSIVLGTQYSEEVSSYMINNSPPAITKTKEEEEEYNSGESCKKPTPKDRRGCYKRRRTSETWTKESPSPYDDDGHAWRKYGQKDILNANHPRNYFRCTHKYDQLCQATKYVQKIQDEPSLHRTTYHGHHTCKKLSESHHYNLMDATNDSSVIWSFQSSQVNNNKSMKQQKTHNHTETKSNNYFISDAATPNTNHHQQNLTPRLSVNHLSAFSSAGSDVISSDGYSCTTSALHNNNTMDIASLMDFEEFLFSASSDLCNQIKF